MRGLEVLQAALAGKRVRFRYLAAASAWSPWLWWNTKKFYMEGMGDLGDILYHLFAPLYEWEIEELSLTFAEVDAAMVDGGVVERSAADARGDVVQYKFEHGVFWMRYRSPVIGEGWSSWKETGLYADDIHATNWVVVGDEDEGESARMPTPTEAVDYLNRRATDASSHAGRYAGWTVEMLMEQWPAMFSGD